MGSRRSFLTGAVAALALAPALAVHHVAEAQPAPVPDHLKARITDVIDHPERYPDVMALARQYTGQGTMMTGNLTVSGNAALDWPRVNEPWTESTGLIAPRRESE